MKLFVLLMTVLLTEIAHGDEGNWQDYRYPNLGISIALPGVPVESILRSPDYSNEEVTTTRSYQYRAEECHLNVSITVFPPALLATIAIPKALENERQLARQMGEVLSEKDISLNGVPGYSIKVLNGSIVIYKRLFFTDDKLIQVVVTGYFENEDDWEEVGLKFMDSLEFIEASTNAQ